MSALAAVAQATPLPAPDALSPAACPPEAWSETPLTWLGMALDRIVLRGMRLAYETALRPAATDLEAARAAFAAYATPELAADPRRFFAFVDAPPPAATVRVPGRRRIAGGEVVTRVFETQYAPWHCGSSWPGCIENDRVTIEHWMHRPGRPRATMLALHGFTMGTPWIDAYVLWAQQWFDAGFDVALLALPFHGPRCPRTARYSGELFGSWDVSRTNEAVRQAVADVHLVKTWIAERTRRPVGVLGLSLGGYLAALVAGLCPDLAFVVPLVPPVHLDALARSLLADDGEFPLAELRAALRVHSPLSHPLAVPRERVLIVGARGDCIVPPEHPYALWQHWGEPPVYWYSGSHMAPFRRARLIARIRAHLDGLGL